MKSLLTWTERRLPRLFRKLSNRQNFHLKAEMFSFHSKYFVYRKLKRASQKLSFCFKCPDTGTVRLLGNILYLVGTFHCFPPKCWRAARSGDKILVRFSNSHVQILKLSKEEKREWLWSLRWISCFKYAHTWSSLVAILQNIVQAALLGNRGKD